MLESFIESLPDKLRCSSNWEEGTAFKYKAKALKEKHIELNQLYKKYIAIDIDKEHSAYSFEENNLPIPTIITINPVNTHCHYLYELKAPVIYTEAGRRKPQQFYESVDMALTKALKGDDDYVGKFTKNPLHECWKVIKHDVKYDLEDFQEYLDINEYKKTRRTIIDSEGRNSTLFNNLRLWAYVEVKAHSSFESFINAVEIRAFMINDDFNTWSNGKLSLKEVLSTAKSVATWTWRHRHTIGNGCNRGIMELPADMPLQLKQSMSADRTNEVRANNNLTKMIDTAKQLKANGKQITQKAVAELSGIHVLTVKRSWSRLENEFNLYVK